MNQHHFARRDTPPGSSLFVSGSQVGEPRALLQEGELDNTCRSVPLLADDDLGQVLVLRAGVVLLLAVDEHHDVGVLLECTRLAQVRQQRAVGPRGPPARGLAETALRPARSILWRAP